jgi:hypothetical protein
MRILTKIDKYQYWVHTFIPALEFLIFIVIGSLALFTELKIDINLAYFFLIGAAMHGCLAYLFLKHYSYAIERGIFSINLGPFQITETPIFDITNINKIRKNHRNYGLSRDLISIKTVHKKELNISPINQALLIETLLMVNPNIQIDL